MARILLIDDDDAVRLTISTVLSNAGHTVTEARDGKEGIARYQPEAIDLVVTDLIMPEKEGLETILDLKKKYPNVKILAVSGGGRMAPEAQLNIAKKFGATRVLAKPFLMKTLSATVDDLLAQKSA
jgi:CheY-like chemotaxis protein